MGQLKGFSRRKGLCKFSVLSIILNDIESVEEDPFLDPCRAGSKAGEAGPDDRYPALWRLPYPSGPGNQPPNLKVGGPFRARFQQLQVEPYGAGQ